MSTRIKRPPEFEPDKQLQTSFDALDAALRDAITAIERIDWAMQRVAVEFQERRNRAALLEIYTEAVAAKLLSITPRALADLRRSRNLPHCLFGNQPRYTRDQLQEICDLLEVRPRTSGPKKLNLAA